MTSLLFYWWAQRNKNVIWSIKIPEEELFVNVQHLAGHLQHLALSRVFLCKADTIVRTSAGENRQQILVCLEKCSVQSNMTLLTVMWLHYRDLIMKIINRSLVERTMLSLFGWFVFEAFFVKSTVYAACAVASWHWVSSTTLQKDSL